MQAKDRIFSFGDFVATLVQSKGWISLASASQLCHPKFKLLTQVLEVLLQQVLLELALINKEDRRMFSQNRGKD